MVGSLFYKLYAVRSDLLRRIIRKIVYKIEGGSVYSKTLRRIFKDYHKVEVGMYTHNAWCHSYCAEPYTKIGRYCSIAKDVRIITINHPMEFKSTHALFWQSGLKFSTKDLHNWSPITIENDVWIGHGAIILPGVRYVGNGAIIGAGAVVNKDVPPYAVVVGNPARIVRYRFSKEVIEHLLASKWWEKDIEQLKPVIDEFQQPYEQLYLKQRGNNVEGNQANTQSKSIS